MNEKGVKEIKETWEWIKLMQEAKKLGLTPEEVSDYLKSKKEEK